jgi:hypothetical protein
LLGIAQVANAAGFFYHSLSSRRARQASA